MSEQKPSSHLRAETLSRGLIFDEEKYEYREDFVAGDVMNPMDVHTVAEMIECLKRNPNVELDAKVLTLSERGKKIVRMDKKQFLENAENQTQPNFARLWTLFQMMIINSAPEIRLDKISLL
jgi:hypothetical protein